MGEIIQNAVVTVLIAVIMGFVFRSIQHKKDQVEADKEALKNGQADSSNPLVSGKLTIAYGKGIKGLIIACLFVAAALFILPLWAGADTWVVIMFGAFFLLGLLLLGYIVVWNVRVDGNDIVYTDFLGRKHNYTFSELEKVVVYKDRIKVLKEGRKLFAIDNNLPEMDLFIELAKKQNVPVVIDEKYRKSMEKNGVINK